MQVFTKKTPNVTPIKGKEYLSNFQRSKPSNNTSKEHRKISMGIDYMDSTRADFR